MKNLLTILVTNFRKSNPQRKVINLLFLVFFLVGNAQSSISLPYHESFETGFGYFTQDNQDGFDWTRWSFSTSTLSTGPSSAADGNYYVYLEASQNTNKVANLLLQNISFDSSITAAYIQFQYHMKGEEIGSLKLQVLDDNNTWQDLWSQEGEKGDTWLHKGVNLSSFISDSFSLRFSGTTGEGVLSDIAMDNVSIIPGSDTSAPIITLIGDAEISLEIGDPYVENGAIAVDNFDGDLSSSIVIAGDFVDTSKAGTYTVTYNVTDSNGNNAVQAERVIVINPDIKPPIITLIGLEYVSQFDEPIETGHSTNPGKLFADINPSDSYNDTNSKVTGFSYFVQPITVSCSGLVQYSKAVELASTIGARLPTLKELQANVTEGSGCGYDSELVWTQSPGENEGERWVDYGSFSYSSPKSISETSTAYVRYVLDNTPLTPLTFKVTVGEVFTDPGVKASDNVDGDISSRVVIGGDVVDIETTGTYMVTYNVSDNAGNQAKEAIRVVEVISPLGLEKESAKMSQIYPNPASKEIRIDGLVNPLKYTIYNSLGQIIKSGYVDKAIDVKGLTAGVYYLKLEHEFVSSFIKK